MRALAEDLREEATLVACLAISLYFGPTPVEEAIARCEHFLAEVTGDRSLEAAIESSLAGLRAMLGDFDEARRLWLRASEQYEELGPQLPTGRPLTIGAEIEMLADDYEAAERELRWGYETLERDGREGSAGTVAAFLADVSRAGPRRRGWRASPRSPRSWRPPTTSCLRPSAQRAGEAPRETRRADEAERSLEKPARWSRARTSWSSRRSTLLSLAEVLEAIGQERGGGGFGRPRARLYEQKGNLRRRKAYRPRGQHEREAT